MHCVQAAKHPSNAVAAHFQHLLWGLIDAACTLLGLISDSSIDTDSAMAETDTVQTAQSAALPCAHAAPWLLCASSLVRVLVCTFPLALQHQRRSRPDAASDLPCDSVLAVLSRLRELLQHPRCAALQAAALNVRAAAIVGCQVWTFTLFVVSHFNGYVTRFTCVSHVIQR